MILPTPLPPIIERGDILLKLWNIIKAIFTAPSKKEGDTPSDVIARNQLFHDISTQVGVQAKSIEEYALSEINKFEELFCAAMEDESETLAQYHIRATSFNRDIYYLKQQIPGLIEREVSRNLNESNQECDRVLRMQAGVQKEVALKTLIKNIINTAVRKCAETTETVLNDMVEDYASLMNEAVNESLAELNKKTVKLQSLNIDEDERMQRETILIQSRLIVNCCDLIRDTLREEIV